MDLRITTSTVGVARLVTLEGTADLAAVPALHAALARATSESGTERIALDIDGLAVLDDVAIGLIIGAAARARATGGDLTLVCTAPRMLDRIAATRLDTIVTVAASIADMHAVKRDDPHIAVIFTSRRSDADPAGYDAMATRMETLARAQPGYRGIESVRGADGVGITVSYWASAEDVSNWKLQAEHLGAQHAGRDRWYLQYHVRIATVTREYEWERPTTIVHVAMPDDWEAARRAGAYTMSTRGVTLAEEGFIHCSFDHQILGVANRFYADVDELVLLRLDPTRLNADVVVEPPFPGSIEHFPHVYGPIALDAVVGTIVWRRDTAGWRQG